ncbi:MAG: relaxase domain-containing protein [Pirellulales bacterium]|nr:relaxase domain-containing protein [Pirellulales bacterium]
MVVIIKVLGSDVPGGGAADAARYYAESAAYYAGDGRVLAQWAGRGAKTLGLTGPPTFETLLAVLAGCDPLSGQPLVPVRKRKPKPATLATIEPSPLNTLAKRKRQARERCPGVDLCLTLPAALNIVWAAGGEQVRKAIEAAIDAAAKRLLAFIEAQFKLARRGFLGVDQYHADLVVAMVDHDTSRAETPQPHRHRHLVIANLGQTEDGRWSAIHTRLLFDWARTLGPIWRCLLSNEILQRVNLPLVPAQDENRRMRGWAEIEGIPQSLRKFWSSRHDEIEEFVQGELRLTGLGSARAKAIAQEKTRLPKQPTPPREVLFAQWEREARAHGFGPEQIEKLLTQRVAQPLDPYPVALREAAAELTQTAASFTRQELIQRVAERLCHTGADGLQIVARIDRDLEVHSDLVQLRDRQGERHFTTRASWAHEQKLLADVAALKTGPGATVNQAQIDAALGSHATATAEQRRAVTKILQSTAQLRTLTGIAGSGKTFVADALRQAFEAAGYRVRGAALSGIAKEELAQQAQITSRTIASYEYHLDRPTRDRIQDRLQHGLRDFWRAARGLPSQSRRSEVALSKRDVWIIDEAGMLDTRTTARCLHHARKVGATLVLMGDDGQLSPIGAGGPFGRIAAEVGGPTLLENRRQRHDADRQAVQLIREGKGDEALAIYAQQGRLTIGKNKLDTLHKLVDAWVAAGAIERPQDHLILTQTRREAQALNRRCQRERQAQQQVAQHNGGRVAEGTIYRGDRVLFHKAYRAAGIENGHQGTVVSVDPTTERLVVRLDHSVLTGRGDERTQPVVVVPLRALDRDAVGLSYAATTHKMQGRTAANVLMLLGGKMVDRELTYVQASRARESTTIFVDQLHAGEELKDLARSISRSRAKRLAHDLVDPPQHKRRGPNLEIER